MVRQHPEGEIHTIGLLPEYQGKGLSHRLLQPLLQVADRLHAPMFLEVREGNEPAVSLYESYGFEKAGLRKNYYQPSGANAWTMVRARWSLTMGTPPPTVPNRLWVPIRNPPRVTVQSTTDNSAPRVILGIESSCDETGVGIVQINQDSSQPDLHILADKVASSMSEHARFGGVVPEIASRAHLEAMQPTMRAALQEARGSIPGSPSQMPSRPLSVGLAGALLVGAAAAKAYAAAWEVPFLAVNHLGMSQWIPWCREFGPTPSRMPSPC